MRTGVRATTFPRMVFTVTAGRTGTRALQKLFATVRGVHAVHEADPNFVDVMRAAQGRPEVARVFWEDRKLPAIGEVGAPVYVETSHLTCKGFLEPLLALGGRPALILLTRDASEIAQSLLSRNAVPGRTRAGQAYLLHPDDPGVLPLPGWRTRMSDYQLCYWYALEIERRHLVYGRRWAARGLPVVHLDQRELGNLAVFERLCASLGIAVPETASFRARFHFVASKAHNQNRRSVSVDPDWQAQEMAVWGAVRAVAPDVVAALAAQQARCSPPRLVG